MFLIIKQCSILYMLLASTMVNVVVVVVVSMCKPTLNTLSSQHLSHPCGMLLFAIFSKKS